MVLSLLLLLLQYVLSAVRELFQWIVVSLCVILVFHRGCSAASRFRRRRRRSPPSPTHTKEVVIAFFHPYCTGGGGGERVLWKMIQVLGDQLMTIPSNVTKRSNDDTKQQQQPTPVLSFHPTIIIYTIDTPTVTYVQGMFVCSSLTLSRHSLAHLCCCAMLVSF